MQPVTLDAALALSPGNKAYWELEDGTLIVVEHHRHRENYAWHTSHSRYLVKDGVSTYVPDALNREAHVWLPLEVLYMHAETELARRNRIEREGREAALLLNRPPNPALDIVREK